MKMLAISIVLALGASAPAFAQAASQPPAEATPAPAPTASDTADATSLEVLGEATTPEDRAMMLRRCAGPPPRPMAQDATKQPPVPAPVVVAGGESSGG